MHNGWMDVQRELVCGLFFFNNFQQDLPCPLVSTFMSSLTTSINLLLGLSLGGEPRERPRVKLQHCLKNAQQPGMQVIICPLFGHCHLHLHLTMHPPVLLSTVFSPISSQPVSFTPYTPACPHSTKSAHLFSFQKTHLLPNHINCTCAVIWKHLLTIQSLLLLPENHHGISQTTLDNYQSEVSDFLLCWSRHVNILQSLKYLEFPFNLEKYLLVTYYNHMQYRGEVTSEVTISILVCALTCLSFD